MGQSTDRAPTPALTRLAALSESGGRGEASVDAIAEAVVRDGVAPIAAAGCARKEGGGWVVETGGAVATLFDLASVTKPMTAVAVVAAHIDKSMTLGAAVPDVGDTASGEAPIELLLAHRAGLAAHASLFAPLLRGERVDRARALREAAEARRPECAGAIPRDGFAPLYSDLSYVLAGEMLARAAGARDAGEAIARLVAEPLGVGAELGTARELEARGIDLVARAAPTEDVPWRGGLVRARVHDENAFALAGAGGEGHAGMFGTIGAVIAFGCAVLDGLPDLAWLVAPRPGGTLRAGFDGKSPEGSSAGERAGPAAFGHLGFTGTSLWIDPDARAVVALLTNRVCPTRDHVAIRAARPLVHDALFARAAALH